MTFLVAPDVWSVISSSKTRYSADAEKLKSKTVRVSSERMPSYRKEGTKTFWSLVGGFLHDFFGLKILAVTIAIN